MRHLRGSQAVRSGNTLRAHWKHRSLPAHGFVEDSWRKIGPASTVLTPAATSDRTSRRPPSPEGMAMTHSNADRYDANAAVQVRDLKLVRVSEDNQLVCPHCVEEGTIFAEEECNRHSSVTMTADGERAVIMAGETAFDHLRFFCENCQRDVELPRGIRPQAL